MLTPGGATGGLALLVGAAAVLSLGLAPLFTLATDSPSAPPRPERAGAAAAISETSSELGGALGIACSARSATAVYRVAIAVPPGGGEARETLGGAVTAADRLPAALRGEVLEPAREAFTQSLQAAATVSGAHHRRGGAARGARDVAAG